MPLPSFAKDAVHAEEVSAEQRERATRMALDRLDEYGSAWGRVGLRGDEGMRGLIRGRKTRTTIPGKDGQRAADLLNRDFRTNAPNRAWVTDFTYVSTWSGFAYVAFAIDLFSRAIVGWSASTTTDVAFVESCLSMALWRRDHTGRPVTAGMIHHRDAGSQIYLWPFH
jgi:transposase InsO family protein